MRLILASHTPRSSVFRVGSHHYAEQLSRRGHQVLHLSTPVPIYRPREWLAAQRSTTSQGDHGVNYVELGTVLPLRLGGSFPGNASLRLSSPSFARLVRDLGFTSVDALIIDQPTFAGVWKYVDSRAIIYRPTDIYESELHRRAELGVVAKADAVVATSETVLIRLGGLSKPKLVLPNGVDFDRFRTAVDESAKRRGAIYVGAVDARFDWVWLAEVAGRVKDVQVKIAGPIKARPPASLPPNVVLLGPVPHEQTPRLMAESSVGLLPFARTAANSGRSPMKLYEYLAAGLGVVGPAGVIENLSQVPGVHWVDSPSDAAEVIRSVIRDPQQSKVAIDAARAQDWSVKAAKLEAFIQGVLGAREEER